MNDAPAADRGRRKRSRPPRSHPTDQDLDKLLAQLAQPAADLLAALSTSALTVLRTLLADAYERGRRDAGRAAANPAGSGQVTIRMSDPPPGPSPAAVAAMAMRQATMGVRR